MQTLTDRPTETADDQTPVTPSLHRSPQGNAQAWTENRRHAVRPWRLPPPPERDIQSNGLARFLVMTAQACKTPRSN